MTRVYTVCKNMNTEMAVINTSDEEEDEVKKIINFTINYIIALDKKELTKLLTDLKEGPIEDNIDTLLKLE